MPRKPKTTIEDLFDARMEEVRERHRQTTMIPGQGTPTVPGSLPESVRMAFRSRITRPKV